MLWLFFVFIQLKLSALATPTNALVSPDRAKAAAQVLPTD
jgi:hypothetical protein